jgi:hypothetical protein
MDFLYSYKHFIFSTMRYSSITLFTIAALTLVYGERLVVQRKFKRDESGKMAAIAPSAENGGTAQADPVKQKGILLNNGHDQDNAGSGGAGENGAANTVWNASKSAVDSSPDDGSGDVGSTSSGSNPAQTKPGEIGDNVSSGSGGDVTQNKLAETGGNESNGSGGNDTQSKLGETGGNGSSGSGDDAAQNKLGETGGDATQSKLVETGGVGKKVY